ncbi:MAG: hypothetical protein GY820_15735 [Gammaproteobacteria bacterium]|nr:hypothetical protein [Gammaproteobacteria bacterium]
MGKPTPPPSGVSYAVTRFAASSGRSFKATTFYASKPDIHKRIRVTFTEVKSECFQHLKVTKRMVWVSARTHFGRNHFDVLTKMLFDRDGLDLKKQAKNRAHVIFMLGSLQAPES